MIKYLFFMLILVSCNTIWAQSTAKQAVVLFDTEKNAFSAEESAAVQLLLSTYFSALQNNQQEIWKSCYGDSILKNVTQKRFNNKFERLKGYGFSGDTIRIVWVGKLDQHYGRQPGDQYQLVVEFGKELNVANRVSFDHLKVYKEQENARRFGITINQFKGVVRVDMLKYQADGTITWE